MFIPPWSHAPSARGNSYILKDPLIKDALKRLIADHYDTKSLQHAGETISNEMKDFDEVYLQYAAKAEKATSSGWNPQEEGKLRLLT